MAQKVSRRAVDAALSQVTIAITSLYSRMCGHIDFEFTEEMAYELLIRPEDVEVVKRAKELYPQFRETYVAGGATHVIIGAYTVTAFMDRKLCFPAPNYIKDKTFREDQVPGFAHAIAPWLEQIVPIREMYDAADAAWPALRELASSDNPVADYARIRALWPTIDALATSQGYNIPKLPNPRGLPAVSPKLREKLTTAETFVNAALLMPEVNRSKRAIELSIS